MPSSNIIRRGQREAAIKIATFEEVDAEAVYQSTWAMMVSNVIPKASEILPSDLPSFEAHIESSPVDRRRPALAAPSGQAALSSAESCHETKPLVAHEGTEALAQQEAEILSAQAQAESIRQLAHEDARRQLEEAHEKARTIEQEAYRGGFDRGQQDARHDLQAQLATVFDSFQRAAAEVTQLRQEILAQAEEDIIALAFRIARKICQHEVLHNRAIIATTIRRALSQIIVHDVLVVRVNPADLDRAQELREAILDEIDGLRQLNVEGDDTVGPGGCMVESAFGEIDARIEAQFEELEHRFRQQSHLLSEDHAT